MFLVEIFLKFSSIFGCEVIKLDKLFANNKIYTLFDYLKEDEFERVIVAHSKELFGENSIYVDVKKKIKNNNIATIPDGYLIDFSFPKEPKLYIIENELSSHDPYKHIGQQILKFAVSYKSSSRKIKDILLEDILNNENKKEYVENKIKEMDVRNIDDLLEKIIHDPKGVSCIIIIDETSIDLENVLAQLTIKTDILEFKTYKNGNETIHRFTPFQEDIKSLISNDDKKAEAEDFDTIVISAKQEGFEEVFLGKKCWYATNGLSISSAMLDKFKYIAGYQSAPISAITHIAEITKIEKFNNTNNYIIHFDDIKHIKQIGLPKNEPKYAPRSPRYTNIERIEKAKTLKDVFWFM